MRKAMGLIQAIMMILIVSGMMVLVLKYASISAKHVADTYIKEQNELFLDSTIEQTLLAISEHNRSTNQECLDKYTPTSVKKRDITYSSNVNIIKYYLEEGSQDLSDCQNTNIYGEVLGISINEATDSHGMALFEIEVNATKTDGTVISRIIRRTLQQP